MAGDLSGEEAAWRDLVERFAAEPADDGSPAPWPDREDLTASPPAAPPGDPVMGPLSRPGPAPRPGTGGATGPLPGRQVPPGADGGGPDGLPGRASGEQAGTAHTHTPPAGTPQTGTPQTGTPQTGTPPAGTPPAGTPQPVPGAGRGGAGPAGRAHVVRPAVPGSGDDHYVPPPPPPLPDLDPVAKGAWTALFGGPAYLLLAVMAGWEVPGWAAFAAVAAFVGGFATLVVRMGDQPPRDSGPDDGAVL